MYSTSYGKTTKIKSCSQAAKVHIYMLAKGPRLGGNIFRGALAPSHGVCYVVQTQMSSH